MDTVVRYVCFLGLVLLLCGCGRYNERRWAHEYLTAAESLMGEQPDSALTLLQSIPEPAILPEAQQMVYRLRLLQAKDKCGWSITADTGIVSAQRYFERRSDWSHAALVAFYRARVWQERNDDRQAMKVYVEAESYAARTDDHQLKGMIQHNIGWIYYHQFDIQKSIALYQKAIACFQEADSTAYSYLVSTYQSLSADYMAIKQLDSALYYNGIGLSIAQHYHNATLLSVAYQGRAAIYREKGKLPEARKCLDSVFNYAPNKYYKPQLYVTLTKFYQETHQLDSAVFYAKKILKIPDSLSNKNAQATAYYLLSSIEKEQGKYREALAYYEQYNALSIKIYQDIQESSVAGLQEKYALALVNNAHQQLTIRHQQTSRLLLFVLIVLILTAFAFYYYHTKKKSALLSMEQQMARLKVLADNYDEKDKTLKNTLLQNFEVVKKLSVLEATLNQEEKQAGRKLLRKFEAIFFDTQDKNYWDNFYHTVDSYCNGRLHVLKDSYPALTDTEFKVCCLCLANFKNDEMAFFMECSESTIRAKKTNIRKKIGITSKNDLTQYFSSILYTRDI